MRTLLTIPIEYDPELTDPESLALAMDRLMEMALSTPGVLDEYGNPGIGEFVVADCAESAARCFSSQAIRSAAIHRRHVLFDFDRQELATTHVYDDRVEAVNDAAQLPDVIVVSLEFEEHHDTPETAAAADADSAESEPGTCDCELPGHFCSGVPGNLAHLENGRLADGTGAIDHE